MISMLEETYCLIDNLTSIIDKKLGITKVGRKKKLSRSELLTIAVIKQKLCMDTNKQLYYLIKNHFKNLFSSMPSYQQFCKGLESNFLYLTIINQILVNLNKQKKARFYIIDSTSLPLCTFAYRYRSKMGKGLARTSKNMNGWYYGFKLHLIINQNMDIVSFKFTAASRSDIAALDEEMVKGIAGYLIGDKGYIGKTKRKKLSQHGITLITKNRKNMIQPPITSKILRMLTCRQRVETVFSTLKERFKIINKKARSITSFFSNMLSSILTYNLNLDKSIFHRNLNAFCFNSVS